MNVVKSLAEEIIMFRKSQSFLEDSINSAPGGGGRGGGGSLRSVC